MSHWKVLMGGRTHLGDFDRYALIPRHRPLRLRKDGKRVGACVVLDISYEPLFDEVGHDGVYPVIQWSRRGGHSFLQYVLKDGREGRSEPEDTMEIIYPDGRVGTFTL